MAYTINIQPVNVGNLGQWTCNSINVVPRPSELTDTSIIVDCYLIQSSGAAVPEDLFGRFTVTLSYPLASSRSSLISTWKTAILTTPNPDLIER